MVSIVKHHIARYDEVTGQPIWHEGGFAECPKCHPVPIAGGW